MTFRWKAATLFFFLGVVVCLPSLAQTNYQFSYFLCSPSTCQEEGPAEKNGSVLVSLNSDCTGGVIGGINKNIEVLIANCSVPYIPYALIQRSTTEYYDEGTCPPTAFYVDYASFNAEIFTAGGVVVYHGDVTYGCDGSESGPTNIGTKPC